MSALKGAAHLGKCVVGTFASSKGKGGRHWMELKSRYPLGGEKIDWTRRLLAEQQPGHWGQYPALPVSLPSTGLLT